MSIDILIIMEVEESGFSEGSEEVEGIGDLGLGVASQGVVADVRGVGGNDGLGSGGMAPAVGMRDVEDARAGRRSGTGVEGLGDARAGVSVSVAVCELGKEVVPGVRPSPGGRGSPWEYSLEASA